MTHIESISPVHREPYKDLITRGKVQAKVDAPVLAFYEIELRNEGKQSHKFDVEIRQSPHGLQLDWHDDLDDFLLQISSRDEATKLRNAISMEAFTFHEQLTNSGAPSH